MLENNLYHVQDDDGPMYVLASSYQEAIERWLAFVGVEYDAEEGDEIEEPAGVALIAKSDDVPEPRR